MGIRENRRNGLKQKKTVYQALVTISQFGINMLVPIFLCFFVGLFLDRKMGTSCFMILFFFMGALAGFRNIYLLARRIYGGTEERAGHGGSRKGQKDNP